MSEVLSGVLGAVGVLVGVWLGQRYAARDAHLARVETRRGEQRRVLSELLIAGREKVDRYTLLLPLMARMSDTDLQKYVDTDSGQALGRINREFQRAIIQARLLIGDPGPAETLGTIRALNDSFSDEAVGKALTSKKSAGGEEDLRAAFAHVGKLRHALNTLETQAIDVLQVTVGAPDSVEVPGRRLGFIRKA